MGETDHKKIHTILSGVVNAVKETQRAKQGGEQGAKRKGHEGGPLRSAEERFWLRDAERRGPELREEHERTML